MSRTAQIDCPIIDQFTVFEPDNFTKKSGLTATDFDINLFKDGLVQDVSSIVVTEIGSLGEYSIAFTPDDIGFWLLEVSISYNNSIYYGEYDVVLSDNSELYNIVKRVLGLSKENFVIDDTEFNANNQQTSCRVRIFESADDVELATEGGSSPPDPEPIASYRMDTIWDSINKIEILKMKKL